MRYILFATAVLALTACDTAIPDSAAGVPDTGAGVGFEDYNDYRQAREAQLAGLPATVQPPTAVQSGPLDAEDAAPRLDTAAAEPGVAPLDASPSNPAPQIVTNDRGISGENDFDAVSAQRDIAADAELIAQNRAQYQVIPPEELPTREGTGRPNIVEYALRTDNPVGTALYRRNTLRAEARYERACGAFSSADEAQEEFLARGGPERDRQGMDPDGDGFACGWNPVPFRSARG